MVEAETVEHASAVTLSATVDSHHDVLWTTAWRCHKLLQPLFTYQGIKVADAQMT
jgi:hypothetical protein